MGELTSTLIDFYNLTGGINTVSSGIRLKPVEAHDMQNIFLFPIGGISKRNGYALLNPTPVSALSCTGLYQGRYSTAGGTNVDYLVNDTKLYGMSSPFTGTWVDKTNAMAITTGPNNIWTFAILNDIVVMGNNTDTGIQISATQVATNLSGLPFTSFLFPLEYRGYMWYFNCKVGGVQQYDTGYFSSINDPATVGVNNYVIPGKGTGGDIRGAIDYKTYLYVFKRNGIYQINYQPTRVNSAGTLFPFTETPNPIVEGVGTQSHRSIVAFTTPDTHQTPGRELVFFVDQFGMPRIFDGVTTIGFAGRIFNARDTAIPSISSLDKTRTPYCFSINYPDKNLILCFMSKASLQQDTVWALDYSTGFALTRHKLASAMNVGTLFEKSNGTFKPYLADYAGNVYEFDTGTSDNGQPIDAYYITGDSYPKSPKQSCQWQDIELRGTTGSLTQKITMSFYNDSNDSPGLIVSQALADTQTTWGTGGTGGTMTWGVSSWAKQGLLARTQEVNVDAKTMRLKVQNANLNETFTLEGWTLGTRPLGTKES